MKRRTKKQTRELRQRIAQLKDQFSEELTFKEIAKMLTLKSAALANYHYKKSKVANKK